MDLPRRISSLIAVIIMISLINFTNAQISWSSWPGTPLYFGLESSAYGFSGNILYSGGGNNSLQLGDNSFWRFVFAGEDYVSNMNTIWSGGCSVYDAQTGNAYFFGGITSDRVPFPYVQVWPVVGISEGPPVQIPTNIVLGEGIRCVIDSTRTVHLFGGKENTSLHAMYSIGTDTWSVLAGIPEGKHQHGAALLKDGLIYVFGGVTTGDEVTDSVYAYNSTDDSWSTKPVLPLVNAVFASTVTNDNSRVYVVGGSNNSDPEGLGAYDSVWYYDSDSANWTVTTSYPFQIKGLAVAISESILYAVGGRLGNGSFLNGKWKGTIFGLPSPSPTPSRTPTPSASPSFGSSPSSTPSPSASLSSNENGKKKTDSVGLALGLGLGVPLGLIAIILAAFALYRMKKGGHQDQEMKMAPAPSNDPESGRPQPSIVKVEPRTIDGTSDYSGRWFIDFKEIQKVKELGKGAFGVVYLCHWRNSDCVVKQLNMEQSDQNSVREFLREADNMRNMKSHPNICWIYGVCANPENPICIVMEYLPEGSLFDLIFVRGQQVTALTAIQIGKDIASGMAHLHAENLLHCDLACRNLLVASKGHGKFTVKIADFGLSRATETGIYNAKEDRKFPIRWSAPEVLRAGTVSKSSDVWSFGVVMWEMIETQRPYTELSNEEVVKSVCQKGQSLPRPTRIEIPDVLWTLMQSCWNMNPGSRPTFDDIYSSLCSIEKNYLADHGSVQNSDSEFSLASKTENVLRESDVDYSKWNQEEQQPLSKRPSSNIPQQQQPPIESTYNTIVNNTNSTSNQPSQTQEENNNNNNIQTSKEIQKQSNVAKVKQQEEIYNTKMKKSSSSDYAVRQSQQLTADQVSKLDDGYAPVSVTSNPDDL